MADERNPKEVRAAKAGALEFSNLPPGFERQIHAAMQEGTRKYGRLNWREKPITASAYYDAMRAHLTAWWEGDDIDPDSRLHHLAKVAANCAVVVDAMQHGKLIDDRIHRSPEEPSMHELRHPKNQ